MDAVIGTLIWPTVTVFCYARFLLGSVIIAVPLLIHVLLNGTKKISKFDALFAFMSSYPLGLYVFSGIISFYAPYTASVSPVVKSLDQSACSVVMKDRPWLRNPFSSVHAIALSNIGELASGLAMITSLQYHPNLRGIPIQISTEYYHKARGIIIARSSIPSDCLENIDSPTLIKLNTDIFDSSSDDLVLARTSVVWSISKKDKSNKSNKID